MTDSLCPSETLQQSPRPQVEIENQSKAIGKNRQLLDVLDSFPGAHPPSLVPVLPGNSIPLHLCLSCP